MEISEFIDTYSDDLIYLFEARSAILTHPLRDDYFFSKNYLDASFCRLIAVFMVGSIEAMLSDWRERDQANILDLYFEKDVQNGTRVSNLYEAFQKMGIQVNREIFDDYLAIKYLRNTIVHGKWKDHEKDWLDRRGFPTDTRKLTKDHLDRIEHVNHNMMLYIATTSFAGKPLTPSKAIKPEKLIRLHETLTRRSDETGILKTRDLDRIIWNNLERIHSVLYNVIEKAAVSYNWTGGRALTEIEALKDAERKRLFYLAARRAGADNYELLTQHRELAHDALIFWRDYWQRAVNRRGLDDAKIKDALDAFQNVERGAPSAESLDSARVAYELIPNSTPVTLLTLYLPIVDPENTTVYLQEAERALRGFRLKRVWYSWEKHGCPPAEEGLDFYDRMREEFGHSSGSDGVK
jgi:hypothetical protein